MAVFWVVAPSTPVEVHGRFRGTCCFHYLGDRSRHHRNVGKLGPVYTAPQLNVYADAARDSSCLS
jgi:hypothetical protein